MYDVIGFVRRQFLVLTLPAIVLPVLAVALILFVLPPEYRARTTVAILPTMVSSELTPPSLTVQGYQQLLESDIVVAKTKKRLVEEGRLGASDPLRVGKEVSSKIFVSRKAEDVSLAPMLQAIAWSGDPDLASEIANTWTQVFLEQTRSLISGSTSPQVAFVEVEFRQARNRLAEVEGQRDDAQDEFDKQRTDATNRWERRLAEYTTETDRLQAKFDAETRRLKETFLGEHDLDTRRAQLTSLRGAYSDLQKEQAQVSSELDRVRLELSAAQEQLDDSPEFLELKKAITDEALWSTLEKTGRLDDVDWNKLKDRQLLTQVPNPVFSDLRYRVSELSIEADSLKPRKQKLEQELDQLSTRIQTLDSQVRGYDADLEGLEKQREASRTALETARETRRAELERSRDAELDRITRRMQSRIGQIERDVQQQRDLFAKLATSFNEATLTKGQGEIEDLRLAAAAIPPEQPTPRRIPLRAAAALLLGLLLGLLIALWRELPSINGS